MVPTEVAVARLKGAPVIGPLAKGRLVAVPLGNDAERSERLVL
jgi:hypothetical protein